VPGLPHLLLKNSAIPRGRGGKTSGESAAAYYGAWLRQAGKTGGGVHLRNHVIGIRDWCRCLREKCAANTPDYEQISPVPDPPAWRHGCRFWARVCIAQFFDFCYIYRI